MLSNDLEGLGLNKNEATVYLALQGLGKTKAGEVIKQTGLHRNLVYQALEALADRRLLTKSTTGSVALFSPTDPIHLLDGIHEAELTAQRVVEMLRDKKKVVDQEITVYEGADGMRSFNIKNAESLRPGESIYVMGSGGPKFEAAMGERALKKYFAAIGKRGGAKVLMYQPQQYSDDTYQRAREHSSFEFRVLPYDMTPSAAVVFTDRSVAFHFYEDPITVIEIKNPHLVEAYKNYFELLWNQQVRVERGVDALKRAFYSVVDDLAPGQEYYSIGSNVGLDEPGIEKMFDEYHAYRVKKGVGCKLLSYRQDTARILERFRRAGDPEGRISEVRPLPRTSMGPMSTILYNEKVFIPIYGEEPTVIVFESKELYRGFKQYFDELWNQDVRIAYGKDALTGALWDMLDELKPGETYRVLGANVGTAAQEPWKSFFDEFHRKSIGKGVRVQMLSYKGGYQEIRQRFIDEGDADLSLSEIRSLRKTELAPHQVNLYRDKALLLVYGDEPAVITLDQKEIFDGFTTYFDELWNRTTETLNGDEGITELCELVLATRKDLYLIAATGTILRTHPKYYETFTRRRKQLGINIHMLANESIRGSAATKLPATTISYLPPEFESPMVVWIFGDYVANVLWEEPQRIFLTHDKGTADSYRNYFKALQRI